MQKQTTHLAARNPRQRSGNLLIVRGGIARTFGSMGSMMALVFLGAGIYLLQEAFSDPLRPQSLGVISGAFIIALATMLIYFIFSPRGKSRRKYARRRIPPRVERPLVIAASASIPCEEIILLPHTAAAREDHAKSSAAHG